MLGMIRDDQLRGFAVMLQDAIAEALDREPATHPLIVTSTRLPERVAKIMVDADVRDTTLKATYDVPIVASSVASRIDPTLGSMDHLVSMAGDLIASAIESHDTELMTQLAGSGESGLLGLGTYIRPTIGTALIGGIREEIYPGWKSQIETGRGSALSSLLSLELRCTGLGQPPDLTILGSDAYSAVIASIEPQQRYTEMYRGLIPMMKLNSGLLYRDSYSDPLARYMLHTSDFRVYVAPPVVTVEVGLDRRLRVSVKRGHQLVSGRRFRSGTIIDPFATDDEEQRGRDAK